VSGRYRGANGRFEVELRVDVDGPRPTGCVSADYVKLSDGQQAGSMRLRSATVTATPTLVRITGRGDFTSGIAQRPITITIPRVSRGALPADATLRHPGPGGAEGAAFRCAYESTYYRTVQLEEAVQRSVTRFDSYDTSSLPSGAAARRLSHIDAFADAGIELRTTRPPAIVDTGASGVDSAWSDAELHAAMQASFTRFGDGPQWAIWLIHATRHVSDVLAGPQDGLLQGLMFDRQGAQRQGCAVFYDAMPGSSHDSLRRQLHTCVHELAHGFNLVHCWQKSMARPPIPSRPAATSWMNYPDRFPGGTDAFWRAFGFAFDELEVEHLRHAFRDDVIMGGAPFLSNAALEQIPDWTHPPRHGADPGLRLAMTAPASFGYGVPVTADLELAASTAEGRYVASALGPRSGTVEIAIRRPDGDAVVFEPLIHHCRGADTRFLRAQEPPIRDAAFLHYGREGYAFRLPGTYELRARYTSDDGSFVLSDVLRIRIQPPRSAADRMLYKLMYGEPQVGALMSLMGSDAPELERGRRALDTIIAGLHGHPVADVARLVQGANAARRFKTVTAAGRVDVREPQLARARALVDPVISVDRMHDAAAVAGTVALEPRAVAQALPAIGTRRGVAPAVDAFIRSRPGEIAVGMPTLRLRSTRTPAIRPPGRAARIKPTDPTSVITPTPTYGDSNYGA
jgi:hypothetical protein